MGPMKHSLFTLVAFFAFRFSLIRCSTWKTLVACVPWNPAVYPGVVVMKGTRMENESMPVYGRP
jgi:hypothetical protein